MGFVIHFYIIFGTNILTQRPSPDCYFFAYFRVLQKRNSKRGPNGMKPLGEIFLEQNTHMRLENHGVGLTWHPRGWGRPLPIGCAPASWAPRLAPGALLPPIYTYVPRNYQNKKNLAPPLQPSVPVRSHLGACSGAPPEGGSATECFYIKTIASPMSCE